MDIGVATNGHYVFSLGTLTRSPARSLAACLVARPARSLGAPSLHSYLHTEEEEGDYRATEKSLAAVVFESTYPSIEGGSRVRQSSC